MRRGAKSVVKTISVAAWCALIASAVGIVTAGENMIGRQSQNEGMLVVPAPGKVTIDGKLDDWDWSGRIWIFADATVRSRHSVEVAAMWDPEYLYLAAKWKDPTPMFNLIDPAVNPDEGWKEDSWQMRVLTDWPLWITTWYYTAKKQPVMHFAWWKDANNVRAGQDATLLVAPPGGTQLGQGVEMAYRADDDGRGFAQEMKIPWKLLYHKSPPKIGPDLVFRLGSEFMWGDPTGKTWPIHRYADNMQPGATGREFFFFGKNIWGDAKLVAKGHVPVRNYVSDEGRIQGTVPVRVTVPKDAARFTVAIEDSAGRPVRTLAADRDPADYLVATGDQGSGRTLEVKWDCLDNWGKLVAPGTYRIRGLTHRGLSARYEMCYYNPGTPPWQTVDGSGSWGADHCAPNNVAAAGDWTVVTWPFAEGGCGIIGIDPEGRKRWGEHRGVSQVAADAQFVYAYVTGWYTKETICRFRTQDGAVAPFVLAGKPRTFDLPLAEILGRPSPGKVTAMAVQGDQLAMALDSGKLVLLDTASAAVRKEFDLSTVTSLAFSTEGKLYGVVGGQVQAIDLATGAAAVVPTPKLEQAGALAVDHDGNLVVVDLGRDSQAKAFSPQGKLRYTCGKKGGRPIRGAFDEQAMSHMSSVAVDARGHVWVVESWSFPRRVSIWGRDGKLVRDYLGNTGYAGAGCYLHDQDPTLAYCGPMEFQLDKEKRTWKLTRVLWVPDRAKGESFMMDTGTNSLARRFRSSASGQEHEYMYLHDTGNEGTGHVVLMDRGRGWQPVAALCLVAHISGKLSHHGDVLEEPSGEMAGLDPYDICLWNDTNRDGRVQRSECLIFRAQPGQRGQHSRAVFSLSNGWGGRLGDDLSIYTDGMTRYKPLSYTDDGAPIYGLDGRMALSPLPGPDIVPVPGENRLLCLSGGTHDMPGMLAAIDDRSGQVQWSYPNPYNSVHGSHRATMPKPGLIIGPLKTCGIARVDDTVGSVALIRGNLGQDFLVTTDGLFVGAMFQDCRLPAETLPEKEDSLCGAPLDGMSEGGEPFNGWFGKQADGKIRLTTGMPRQAAMILEINGLASIRRFDGGTIAVALPAIVEADRENSARAQAAARPKQYTIASLPGTPKIDASPAKWKDVPPLAVGREGSPDRANFKLAYDAANLYLLAEVQDLSPWKNAGRDFGRLFKTGDAVDLQLCIHAEAKPHHDPRSGDLRVLIAPLDGKPAAVLMVPVDKSAPAAAAKDYTSPVGTRHFDRVEVLTAAQIAVRVTDGRYTVEAAVPLASLGLVPQSGLTLRGDVGFISSDAQGLSNTARTYWANPNTNLVNDEPMEAWLTPDAWGEFQFK
jgi:sugar lactone lactonase YvrE